MESELKMYKDHFKRNLMPLSSLQRCKTYVIELKEENDRILEVSNGRREQYHTMKAERDAAIREIGRLGRLLGEAEGRERRCQEEITNLRERVRELSVDAEAADIYLDHLNESEACNEAETERADENHEGIKALQEQLRVLAGTEARHAQASRAHEGEVEALQAKLDDETAFHTSAQIALGQAEEKAGQYAEIVTEREDALLALQAKLDIAEANAQTMTDYGQVWYERCRVAEAKLDAARLCNEIWQ